MLSTSEMAKPATFSPYRRDVHFMRISTQPKSFLKQLNPLLFLCSKKLKEAEGIFLHLS
jgi:hypothetical protein